MPEKVKQVELPIEWNVPDNIVSRYATNLTIQRTENEYIISFFEIKQPIILGDPEKIVEKLKALKSVQAECVARIVVAANKMPSFVKALETSAKRYAENVKINATEEKE